MFPVFAIAVSLDERRSSGINLGLQLWHQDCGNFSLPHRAPISDS